MTTLTRVSRQWMTRPDDERFTSLPALAAYAAFKRQNSKQVVLANREIRFVPDETDPDHKGLYLQGPTGGRVVPTEHSFQQMCGRVKAPAAYLETLPAPLVADCLNAGLHLNRTVDDIGLLVSRPIDPGKGLMEGPNVLRSANGPNYGRVWDADVAAAAVEHLGDGLTGKWRVPGPFKSKLTEVTVENTTIFAGERDMFVFLVDDDRRIDLKDRRNGETGELARGMYFWNSEVAAGTLGVAYFLYDYMCSNRMIWGVKGLSEIRIRHTKGAPARFLEEVLPTIEAYAKSSQQPVLEVIEAARKQVMGDKLEQFLADRFGGRADQIQAAHIADEGRPMETLWDVITGVTAMARAVPVQAQRVALEREAGKLLAMAA